MFMFSRVWNLNDFGEQAEKLLPHPAFVYCAQFHPRVDTIVVTGGFDQVIRIWDISGEEPHGNVSIGSGLLVGLYESWENLTSEFHDQVRLKWACSATKLLTSRYSNKRHHAN